MDTSSKKLNVFVCWTSFQLFFSTLLIEKYGSESENVIVTKLAHSDVPDVFDQVISISGGKISRAVKLKKGSRQIKNLVKGRNECELFFPHLFNLATNHLYHFLVKESSRGNFRLLKSAYSEGLLSFYSPTVSRDNKENKKRVLLSRIFNLHYKAVNGSMVDAFNDIDYIYSFAPELTIQYSATSIKKVDFGKSEYSGTNVVFLGRKSFEVNTKDDESQLATCMATVIAQHPGAKVFYKPHPRFGEADSDLCLDLLKSMSEPEILKSSENIESQIEPHDIGVAISITSSALVTLKATYGASFRAVSIGMDLLNHNAASIFNLKDFRRIYEYFNVEIIDLPTAVK